MSQNNFGNGDHNCGYLFINIKKEGEKLHLSHSLHGIIFALLGALGQAAGLVLSKYGMGDFNAFAATQIRVISGIVGFVLIFSFLRKWDNIKIAIKNKPVLRRIGAGAFFGPFLVISFSLLAIQQTGVASTIIANVPVLIIPPSVLIFKERVNFRQILGVIITLIVVSIFYL